LKSNIIRDDSLDLKLLLSEMRHWIKIYYRQRVEPRLEAIVVRDETLAVKYCRQT